MPFTNYHCHASFCDGEGEPAAFAEAAVAKGLSSLGFSSHAPLPFESPWCLGRGRDGGALGRYRKELTGIRDLYRGVLDIKIGLEVDWLPGLMGPADPAWVDFDYRIGSVHFLGAPATEGLWAMDDTAANFASGLGAVYGGDIRALVRDYYEAVEASGCIVEVNTGGMARGWMDRPYPAPWLLGRIADLGIPVTLDSDCHHPRDIAHAFPAAAALMASLGIREAMFLDGHAWSARPLFAPMGHPERRTRHDRQPMLAGAAFDHCCA